MRRSLDKTLEFVRSLDRATSQAEICAQILEKTRSFGVEHVLAGTIPLPGEMSRSQRSNVLLDSWPTEWAVRYFSRNYIFSDPAIRLLPEGHAFVWSEIEHLTKIGNKGQRVMEEAADFGLRNGITIPLLPLENEVIGFSLAGRHLEVSPMEQSMLTMLASYAVGRAIAIRDDAERSRVELNEREIEILRWLSDGHVPHEISARLNISDKGVEWHLRNIRMKLSVKTTTWAVAEAIRLGLVA